MDANVRPAAHLTYERLGAAYDAFGVLHPLLAPRYAGLAAVTTWLDRLASLLDKAKRPNGAWVPVSGLSTSLREQIDAAASQALEDAEAGALPPVPFHGAYQAGILPPAARQTAVISFNTTADGRGELIGLFRTITDRARFLTAGGTPPPVGIGGAPSDSGTLGPAVVPDGLTVTLGVGGREGCGRFLILCLLSSQIECATVLSRRVRFALGARGRTGVAAWGS